MKQKTTELKVTSIVIMMTLINKLFVGKIKFKKCL